MTGVVGRASATANIMTPKVTIHFVLKIGSNLIQ